jgi:hypothetical protein
MAWALPRAARPTSFGLVGVRERVLMLGGSMSLDSEPGEGTSLSVAIPLKQENNRDSSAGGRRPHHRPGRHQAIDRPGQGHAGGGEASNGEQLLETLRHTPCEVVLLDISMPGSTAWRRSRGFAR